MGWANARIALAGQSCDEPRPAKRAGAVLPGNRAVALARFISRILRFQKNPMRTFPFLSTAIVAAAVAPAFVAPAFSQEKLTLKKGDHIAIVGSGLADR